jgi:hypothetical protein
MLNQRVEGENMPHKEVKRAIEELRVELQKTPRETGVFEEILDKARDGIDRFTPEAVQELVETLQRESDEFEVEHPRVTALINQLTNALSSLGI